MSTTSLLFNLALVSFLLGTCGYLLHLRRQETLDESGCDIQLKAIHDYLNESMINLFEAGSKKLDGQFESERDDSYRLLVEQLTENFKLATNFNTYCTTVSAYPGWSYYVSAIRGVGVDLGEQWEVDVQIGRDVRRTFYVPIGNIAYLIDRFAVVNENNRMLIEMIKNTEQ